MVHCVQVWSRPCDLLVRFYWRTGLPARQRNPAQRLLPYRHLHSVPCLPARPTATGSTIRTKRKDETWSKKKKVNTDGRLNGRGRRGGCVQQDFAIAFLQCENTGQKKKKNVPELHLNSPSLSVSYFFSSLSLPLS